MGHIRVNGLAKAYKQYPGHWSRLLEWILPRRARPRHHLKWVLQDINFAIEPGEAVGIIGVNGAGKSTLLKLITGTTVPTCGQIAIGGRVAALLELGMGFHPDFSGRQNVVMAGQLNGLGIDEIAALMPAIEAFAEIGDYIDEPVRVYSSGMQMRLAFAVATCVRPEILIVDEALAVGDVFFQQKCFDRINSFTKAGTTLLFVSHSAGIILNICSRCILLKQGAIAFDGAPKDALDLYQAELLRQGDQAAGQISIRSDAASLDEAGADGAPAARVDVHEALAALRSAPALDGKTGSIVSPRADCVAVRFFAADGKELHSLPADQNVTLQIDYRFNQAVADPHVGFKIRNRFGVVMFETNTYCMRQQLGAVDANRLLSVRFAFGVNLFPDEYTITCGLGAGGFGEGSFQEVLNYLHEVRSFMVLPNPAAITWAGLVNLTPELEFNQF
jgi:lipopolysaccharide transport system ATP-binding protein